jgi:hypothetical protein
MRSIGFALILAALAGAPAAQAATVRIDAGTLFYDSAPGEVDDAIENDSGWIFDGAFVQAGAGCTQEATRVTCPPAERAQLQFGDRGDFLNAGGASSPLKALTVTAGAGDDKLLVKLPDLAADVDGGDGNDGIEASGRILGGAGNDIIKSAKSTFIQAGDGNDRVTTRSTREVRLGAGNDSWTSQALDPARSRIYGEGGNDVLTNQVGCVCAVFGGAGNDMIRLDSRLTLAPALRGQKADGGAGADIGIIDGMDCAKSLEKVTFSKRTRSDKKYRCRTPGAKLS